MGIVLCDLDSTIADTRHRSEKSPHKDPDATWASYAALCKDDVVMPGTAALLHLLEAAGYEIIYLSSRHESARVDTVAWIKENKLPFHGVQLQSAGDPTDSVEYKKAFLHHLQSKGQIVVLALDDWPQVVDMFNEEGVPAVCINPQYAMDPMAWFHQQGYVSKSEGDD
jgi:selenophosphate synthetase-related protein